MGLITPGRLTRQSQQPLQIDWANPITRGLVLAQSGMLDGGLTNNGGVSRVPRAGGITRKYAPGSAQYLSGTVNLSTPMTFFAVVTPRVSGVDMAFMGASSTGADRHLLYVTGSNLVAFFSASSAGTAQAAASAVISSGTTCTVAGRTSNNGSRDVWVNGAKAGTDTTTLPVNTCTQAAVGAYLVSGAPNASFYFDGEQSISLQFNRALSDAELQSLSANPWQVFRNPQRRLVFDVPAGGTDTPINPAVGALALTGYSPTIAQSVNQAFTPAAGSLALTGYAPSVAQSSAAAVNPGAGSLTLTGYAPTITQPQSVAPGAGALTITGFAPSVTQGITTTIAPGAGSLAFTGYAPSVAQSLNQIVAPSPGTLAITGYAPTLAQTANQSILPAVGSLAIAGYAPTVAQALASPNLTPGAGVLSIIGYAPSVVQAAPVTKFGGDDVPREDDERIEIWEPRKLQAKRDDSLDKVVREAYAKATGKPIAAAVAKQGPSVRAPDPEPFDYDEDDFEVLLLSY